MLDFPTRTIQTQSAPENAGTKQLALARLPGRASSLIADSFYRRRGRPPPMYVTKSKRWSPMGPSQIASVSRIYAAFGEIDSSWRDSEISDFCPFFGAANVAGLLYSDISLSPGPFLVSSWK